MKNKHQPPSASQQEDPIKRGRHKKMDDGKRVNVYLDAVSMKNAAEIGGGKNISEGIRIALRKYRSM